METSQSLMQSTAELRDSLARLQKSGAHDERVRRAIQQQRRQLEFIQDFIGRQAAQFETAQEEAQRMGQENANLAAQNAALLEEVGEAQKCRAEAEEDAEQCVKNAKKAELNSRLLEAFLGHQIGLVGQREVSQRCSRAVLGAQMRAAQNCLQRLENDISELENKLPSTDKAAQFSLALSTHSAQGSMRASSLMSLGRASAVGSSLFRSSIAGMDSRRANMVNEAIKQGILQQELHEDIDEQQKKLEAEDKQLGKLKFCTAILAVLLTVCVAI